VPLIEIQATAVTDAGRVAREITANVAEALDGRPDVAWVVWRALDDEAVTIGPETADAAAVAHVYLTRSPEEVEAVVDAVAETLERELGLASARVLVCAHAFSL
jgi:hypothetical protein